MVGVSKEVVGLIYGLLPGFIAAWIYYGLTAHSKQSPFERAVHALILTAVVRALVIPTKLLLLQIGKVDWLCFADWSNDVEFFWSVAWAVALGHAIAWLANSNAYHAMLDRVGVTKRTSYPSEWYSAFSRHKRFVILHIDGERRVMGWPSEWPDQSDSGHFSLLKPRWLLDDNTQVPIEVDELMLVPAAKVEIVEFLRFSDETTGLETEINKAEEALVALQDPKANNTEEKGR